MNPDQLAELVSAAESQEGEHEEQGQNIGTCNKYQQTTGNGNGDSWCMSFVVWCLVDLLGYSPIPRSGSCETVRQWAKTKGILSTVPGFARIGLVIDARTNRAHHTFIVSSSPDAYGSYGTVEGNTNTNGSSNGTGVFCRTRGGANDPCHYEFVDLSKVKLS